MDNSGAMNDSSNGKAKAEDAEKEEAAIEKEDEAKTSAADDKEDEKKEEANGVGDEEPAGAKQEKEEREDTPDDSANVAVAVESALDISRNNNAQDEDEDSDIISGPDVLLSSDDEEPKKEEQAGENEDEQAKEKEEEQAEEKDTVSSMGTSNLESKLSQLSGSGKTDPTDDLSTIQEARGSAVSAGSVMQDASDKSAASVLQQLEALYDRRVSCQRATNLLTSLSETDANNPDVAKRASSFQEMEATTTTRALSLAGLELFSDEERLQYSSVAFTSNQFITKPIRGKKNPKRVFHDEYAVERLVGKGKFGSVYNCIHLASGHERAVKTVAKSISKLKNKPIRKEFDFMCQLDHPNLVKTFGFYEDPNHYYIVMDLYEQGDLFDYLKQNGPLRERDVALILQGIMCGLQYCHETLNIAHRDVKLENVMLGASGGNNFVSVKLIDFGLAKELKRSKKTNKVKHFYDVVGNIPYLSPQVIEGDGYLGPACDMWAVGVLAFVLLTGHFPFEADDKVKQIKAISRGQVHYEEEPVFQKTSPECTKFLRQLLAFEENDRASAKWALRHGWIHEYTQPKFTPIWSFQLNNRVKSALVALERSQPCCYKLKQAVGALIVSQFLCQQERTDSVFRALDKGHLGMVTAEELESTFADYFPETELTTDRIEEIVQQITFSGGRFKLGSIKCSELAAALVLDGNNNSISWEESQGLVDAVYNHLDAEDKGYITTEDLQSRLQLDEVTSKMMVAEVNASDIHTNTISKAMFEHAVLGDRNSEGAIQTDLRSSIRRSIRRSISAPQNKNPLEDWNPLIEDWSEKVGTSFKNFGTSFSASWMSWRGD